MHARLRITATLSILALVVSGSVVNVRHTFAQSAVVGHVYVDGNTTGMNTVAVFDRHADGTLTPTAGSPFSIGGAGTGAGLGSQGAMELSADHRFLLAVDAGSNQISVLRLNADGSLAPVMGSPFPSGGNEPVSIAVHGRLVYVANTGAGGSNYTGFVLGPHGHLAPIFGSTISLPDNSGLGDVLINADGKNLVGVRVNTSLVDSFAVSPRGDLVAAPGSPFTTTVAGPFGSVFQPTNSGQLFVTNAHGGTDAGSVSAYAVTANGILSTIGSGPFANNQTAPCWAEITANGQYLFTANAGSNSISTYVTAVDGSLTVQGSLAINGIKPLDLRLDPTNNYLYSLDSGSNAIGAYSVTAGVLTELAGSPVALPASITAAGGLVTN